MTAGEIVEMFELDELELDEDCYPTDAILIVRVQEPAGDRLEVRSNGALSWLLRTGILTAAAELDRTAWYRDCEEEAD